MNEQEKTQLVNRLLVIFLVVMTAVAIYGCAPQEDTQPDESAQPASNDRLTTTSATGVVVPATQANLSFTIAGTVVEMLVEEGDSVQAGDVIARLDATLLDAELARAEASVVVAQANLDRVLAGPHPEQIAEAEGNLVAAYAAAGVPAAQRGLLQADPAEADIATARARIQRAFINAEVERIQYEWVRGASEHPEDYSAAEQAELPNLETQALTNYNEALSELSAAQAALDALLAGPNADLLQAAGAEVSASASEVQLSKNQLDLLLAGPSEEEIALFEVAVTQAEVALEIAREARARAELVAPFDGTIGNIYVSEAEFTSPGRPVLQLATLHEMMVETTDLSEIDVIYAEPGSAVTVTFDALPSVELTGTIDSIAPNASQGSGVYYTVLISLGETPPSVRWGMTAFVDIPSN